MSEIKFRAWTGQEIVHVDSMQYEPSEGSMIANRCWLPHAIMQYTGLKDKNGKEIYEGDICQLYTFTKTGLKSKERIMPVEFHHGMFSFCGHTIDLDFYVSEYNAEIIGNIYENPELLEVNDE